MGLPHVPPLKVSKEESTSVSSLMQMTAQFGTVGSFGLSEMNVRQSSNRLSGDISCTSSWEHSRDCDLMSLCNDGVATVHKTWNESMQDSHHRSRKTIQAPASRIVGFETNMRISNADEGTDRAPDEAHLAAGNGIDCKLKENSRVVARKRLLSPLNGMHLADEFSGEHLNIGNSFCHGNFSVRDGRYSVSLKESKKAHVDNLDNGTPSLPALRRSDSPSIFTNGLVFDILGHRPPDNFSSFQDATCCSGITESDSDTQELNLVQDTLTSPPFSLSPLGPRVCGSRRYSRGLFDPKQELDESYIDFKDVELSLEGTLSSFLSSHKSENMIVAGKGLEDDENFPMSFEQLTPESLISIQGHNSLLTSQNAKVGRSLSGLSVRRSLVGSFEESLLSGRLASGMVSQVHFLRVD